MGSIARRRCRLMTKARMPMRAGANINGASVVEKDASSSASNAAKIENYDLPFLNLPTLQEADNGAG